MLPSFEQSTGTSWCSYEINSIPKPQSLPLRCPVAPLEATCHRANTGLGPYPGPALADGGRLAAWLASEPACRRRHDAQHIRQMPCTPPPIFPACSYPEAKPLQNPSMPLPPQKTPLQLVSTSQPRAATLVSLIFSSRIFDMDFHNPGKTLCINAFCIYFRKRSGKRTRLMAIAPAWKRSYQDK